MSYLETLDGDEITPGPTLNVKEARQLMTRHHCDENDLISISTASLNFIQSGLHCQSPSQSQYGLQDLKTQPQCIRAHSCQSNRKNANCYHPSLNQALQTKTYEKLSSNGLNPFLLNSTYRSYETDPNSKSAYEVKRVWGPFKPFPVLLSESVLGFGWQEKYLLLRQVFSDALMHRFHSKGPGQMGSEEPRITLSEFEYIMGLYPCLGKAYLRDFFSIIDYQGSGAIEETDFISAMLASAPDAPNLLTKDAPKLCLSLTQSSQDFPDMTLTTVERDSGISPITLIRLQMIFMSFDLDGDGLLNLCELTHLITRLLTVIAGEKRTRGGSQISSFEAPLGSHFWNVVRPLSCPADTGFKGETGRAVPRNPQRPVQFFSQPRNESQVAEESEFKVSLSPAKKTFSDLLNSSMKKWFGGSSELEQKRHKPNGGKKPVLKCSLSSKQSQEQKKSVSVSNRFDARKSSSKPSIKLPEKTDRRKGRSLTTRTSYFSSSSSKAKEGAAKSMNESQTDDSRHKAIWDYSGVFPLSSPNLRSSSASVVSITGDQRRTESIRHRRRSQSRMVSSEVEPCHNNDTISSRLLTTTSSIGSSLAAEVAASIANAANVGISRGIASLLNSVSSSANLFGQTCSADTTTGGFFCNIDENEPSNEFRIENEDMIGGQGRLIGIAEGRRINEVVTAEASSCSVSPLLALPSTNQQANFETHCDMYGCYNDAIAKTHPAQFIRDTYHTASPAIVHRSPQGRQWINTPTIHDSGSFQSRPSIGIQYSLSNACSQLELSVSPSVKPMSARRSSSQPLNQGPSLWSNASHRNSSTLPQCSNESVNSLPPQRLHNSLSPAPSFQGNRKNPQCMTNGTGKSYQRHSNYCRMGSTPSLNTIRNIGPRDMGFSSQPLEENSNSCLLQRSSIPALDNYTKQDGREIMDHPSNPKYHSLRRQQDQMTFNQKKKRLAFMHDDRLGQVALQTTTTSTSIAPESYNESTFDESSEYITTNHFPTSDANERDKRQPLSSIAPDMIDYWRRLLSEAIAKELLIIYDLFGDQRGICFAEFIQAIRKNDIPGTELLLRTRKDFASVVQEKQDEAKAQFEREPKEPDSLIDKMESSAIVSDEARRPFERTLKNQITPNEVRIDKALIASKWPNHVVSSNRSPTVSTVQPSLPIPSKNQDYIHLDSTTPPVVSATSKLFSMEIECPVLNDTTTVTNSKEQTSEGTLLERDAVLKPHEKSTIDDHNGHQYGYQIDENDKSEFQRFQNLREKKQRMFLDNKEKIKCSSDSSQLKEVKKEDSATAHQLSLNIPSSNLPNSNSATHHDISSYLSSSPFNCFHHTESMIQNATSPQQKPEFRQHANTFVDSTPLDFYPTNACNYNANYGPRSVDSKSEAAPFKSQAIEVAYIKGTERTLPNGNCTLPVHDSSSILYPSRQVSHSPLLTNDQLKLEPEETVKTSRYNRDFKLSDGIDFMEFPLSCQQFSSPEQEKRHHQGPQTPLTGDVSALNGLLSSELVKREDNLIISTPKIERQKETQLKVGDATTKDNERRKINSGERDSTFESSTASGTGSQDGTLAKESKNIVSFSPINDITAAPPSDLSWSTVLLLQNLAETHERNISLARRTIATVNKLKPFGWKGPISSGGSTELSLAAVDQVVRDLVVAQKTTTPFYLQDQILSLRFLWNLCDAVVEILRYEPSWIKLQGQSSCVINSPIIKIEGLNEEDKRGDERSVDERANGGDHCYEIHPQLRSFMTGKENESPIYKSRDEEAPIVIIPGHFSFATRNTECLELIGLLFAMKLLYPSKLILLRGSTEDFLVARAFGFDSECCARYGESNGREILRRIFDVFEFLPICATIEMHNGAKETVLPFSLSSEKRSVVKKTRNVLVLTGDVPCVPSTLLCDPASHLSIMTQPKNPIPSLVRSINTSSNDSIDDRGFFTDTLDTVCTPAPQSRGKSARYEFLSSNEMTGVNQGKLSQDNTPKDDLQYYSCASRIIQGTAKPITTAAAAAHEYRTALQTNCSRKRNLEPLQEDLVMHRSLSNEYPKDHVGNSDLLNNYFEIVWSSHDMLAFNQRTRNDLVDFENVGKRIETCRSITAMETPRRSQLAAESSSLFFGSSYLSSSRFTSCGRHKFLSEIEYDGLIRPVMFNHERLISFESKSDLKRRSGLISSGQIGLTLRISGFRLDFIYGTFMEMNSMRSEDNCYENSERYSNSQSSLGSPCVSPRLPFDFNDSESKEHTLDPSSSISIEVENKDALITPSRSRDAKTQSGIRSTLQALLPGSIRRATQSNSGVSRNNSFFRFSSHRSAIRQIQ